MPTYSVAIRTLGTNPILKNELKAIFSQSLKPDKVLVFIPFGYNPPAYKIGDEKYIQVKRGMINQRILPYDEIISDCILMLDDDVFLQSDSVGKLLKAMEENNADLVGADTFQNHKLPLSAKIKAAVTNLVFPHYSQKWAFKIHRNGSFSYLTNPKKSYYPSQSCAGNAMLWKKSAYNSLHLQDELWLDNLPFAYNDDMLESYKVYKNGFNLGVVFDSGIRHLDSKSASSDYQENPEKIKIRTMAQLAIWWRTCFKPGNSSLFSRIIATCAFILKMLWLCLLLFFLSLVKFNLSYISNFLKGLDEGWKFVHSEPFSSLPPYVIR